MSSRTLLLLTLWICACAAKTIDAWPGRSTVPAGGADRHIPPQLAHERWNAFDSLGTLALVQKDALSTDNHEPFRWNLFVRVTPNALPSYLNWTTGSIMPDDTWLVAEHRPRRGSVQGPYYFAHKTPKGWKFGAATPDGWLLATTNTCDLCHADAPADYVFGLVPAAAESTTKTKRPDGG